jgi:Helix-turn-helix domain
MQTVHPDSAAGTINRREQFSKMPETILHDPRLSDRAKLALLEVATFAWGPESRCWASVETMARRMHWSTRKMQYALRELRDLGFVEAEDRPGKTTRYRPLQDRAPLQDLAPLPLQDRAPEVDEVEVDEPSRSRRSPDHVRESAREPAKTTTTNVEDLAAKLLRVYDWQFERKFGRAARRKDGDLERAREVAALTDLDVFEEVADFAFRHHEYSMQHWPRQFPRVEVFEGAERSYRADPPDEDDLEDVTWAEDDR